MFRVGIEYCMPSHVYLNYDDIEVLVFEGTIFIDYNYQFCAYETIGDVDTLLGELGPITTNNILSALYWLLGITK